MPPQIWKGSPALTSTTGSRATSANKLRSNGEENKLEEVVEMKIEKQKRESVIYNIFSGKNICKILSKLIN